MTRLPRIGSSARAAAMPHRLRAFAADEAGAVATDWAFMTAAICGCGIAVIATLSGGSQQLSLSLVERLTQGDVVFTSQNFGRDRITVLLEGPRGNLNDNQVRVRYERFADPQQRTDAQVRNAHRTWARRAADPTYSNPGRAQDMVRILEMAMDLREVAPHNNI